MIYKDPPADFKKEIDVVGCYVEHSGTFLLLHRHNHKSNGNTWGLPAGKAEPNETPLLAMVRELREETGLEVPASELDYFGAVSVRHNSHDFEYHMFSIAFENMPAIQIAKQEHQGFRWSTPQQSLTMNLVEDQDDCIKLFFNLA
jgi:8-oxo-dGTP diphosphatase